MRPTKPKQTFDPRLSLAKAGKGKKRTDYHKNRSSSLRATPDTPSSIYRKAKSSSPLSPSRVIFRTTEMIAITNAPFIHCPQCGSNNFRCSQVRNTSETLKSILGILPFRCLRCSERFCASIWSLNAARYARCPKCLRMDLSTWAEEFYRPALGTRMLLRIGATRYRCEFCRCNFASFRLCRRRFSRHRRESAI
jgi:hypothetical protein